MQRRERQLHLRLHAPRPGHLEILGRTGRVLQQRARGKNHHAALRALGNRWLEVLWYCLTNSVHYDEAIHVANRNRALAAITASAA